MRQLHDLDVDVVIRVRYAVVQCKHFVHTGCARHQLEHSRLRPYHDMPREGPQRTDQPNELNGIAHSMITANQNTPAGKRLACPNMLQMTGTIPVLLA